MLFQNLALPRGLCVDTSNDEKSVNVDISRIMNFENLDNFVFGTVGKKNNQTRRKKERKRQQNNKTKKY